MAHDYIDYWGNSLPKCPHCGTDFQVWDGDNPHGLNYEDEGHTTLECDSCQKEFICVTQVKYTFSTAISEETADDGECGPREPVTADPQ